MNLPQMVAIIDAVHRRLLELTHSKGTEYATSDDRLSNFKDIARTYSMEPEQVLMIYMAKHLRSIESYTRDVASGTERVYSEPIEGRIDDAILYLVLLQCLRADRIAERHVRHAGQ